LPILSAINEAGGGVPLVNKSSIMAQGGMTTNITNQVDTTSLESILDRYFNQPIKTYVVADDVTKQQNKDTRLSNRTSF